MCARSYEPYIPRSLNKDRLHHHETAHTAQGKGDNSLAQLLSRSHTSTRRDPGIGVGGERAGRNSIAKGDWTRVL